MHAFHYWATAHLRLTQSTLERGTFSFQVSKKAPSFRIHEVCFGVLADYYGKKK